MRRRSERSPSLRALEAAYAEWAADEEAVAEAIEWSNALIGDGTVDWDDTEWESNSTRAEQESDVGSSSPARQRRRE